MIKFFNWLTGGKIQLEEPKKSYGIALNSISYADHAPRVTPTGSVLNFNGAYSNISVINAINGRIIQIGNYQPNNHGPEWTYEHFIVPEGEPLEPAIATILLMKGMK